MAVTRVETGGRIALQETAREEERSHAAVWFWSATAMVIVWSLSYLLRQPGAGARVLIEPFSPFGNFAIEGILLSMMWLGVLLTVCLALLSGAARIEDPSA